MFPISKLSIIFGLFGPLVVAAVAYLISEQLVNTIPSLIYVLSYVLVAASINKHTAKS